MLDKSIKNINFAGKRVLVRVDFNVPLDKDLNITDDTRIIESLPTIRKIVETGGIAILMSHLGRPKGPEAKFSLEPVAKHLSVLLGQSVIFHRDLFDNNAEKMISTLNSGDVVLLENLRFYKEEEAGDENFAKQLASLADIYVNDAFGTAHRAHCSTATVAKFFPNAKYFGFLLENEIVNLNKLLSAEKRPFTAIIGGAKVSSKIDIIRNLSDKVDNMIIGGGMSFTFIKALGGKVGNSLVENDKLDVAREIVSEMLKKGVNLLLPNDAVVADAFANDANVQLCNVDNIPDGWMGLDLGKQSVKRFAKVISESETILWNGPMGVFEFDNFTNGTKALAISTAAATLKGSFSAIGGGDSVAAINRYKLANQISYISTGGGAMLEYLEGKVLPGIAAVLK